MKVFCDMDGVLVNFNKAACALVNHPYPPSNWDWIDEIPGNRQKIDDQCTADFWRNLEWRYDGKAILSILTKKFNDIYLLTCPMLNAGSGTGKMQWVNKHIPSLYNKLIITRASKSLFANPDTLLIDDKDENVDNFRAAGGQAILINRPWNKGCDRADKTVEDLKRFLEER